MKGSSKFAHRRATAAGALVAMLGWSAAAAGTTIAGDAAPLLAQVRDATGAAGWQRVRGVGVEGTVTASGLDGTYRAMEDARTGRFDRRSRFAVFDQRDVWDGRIAWRQDNSGGVHRLDGDFATKRNATDGWLARRGWLQPAAAGAWIGPVAQRLVDGVDCRVVTAIPAGGQAVTLFFDARTFDLVRTERVMPTTIQVTRYADHRVVDGIRLPFSIETDDQDDDVEAVHVARYDLRVRIAADGFAAPRNPDDWTMTKPSITVPFDLRNGVLTIEAKIDGAGPFRFIFDTGGHAIVSPELAKALGLATVGAGQSGGAGEGTLTEQYTRVARLDIGGLSLTEQHFYVLPLGYATFEQGDRAPIGGLLGVELLERFAVRFDYPARTVTFTPFASHRFDPRATLSTVRFDDDIPLVPGRIDGQAGVFALDTGNAGSVAIQQRWAERLGIADRLKRGIESASFGAGGVSRNWASRIDRFEIGGTTLAHLAARTSDDRRGSFASRTEAGNIGTQLLANFAIDFDYRRGLMSWRYVPGYVAPPFNRGGLRARKDGPQDFVVVVVAKDSPAATAGVRAQDRIVAIDGVAAPQLSGADFADTFAKPPGTIVTLALMRDGVPLTVAITLVELLP